MGAIVAASVRLDCSMLKSAEPRDGMMHQLIFSAGLFGFNLSSSDSQTP